MASRPLFAPSARQTQWLIALGLVSLGYAIYLRYQAIELTSVGLGLPGRCADLALRHPQSG